jgi:hypothetical protein
VCGTAAAPFEAAYETPTRLGIVKKEMIYDKSDI